MEMLFTSKFPTTPKINASGCFLNTPTEKLNPGDRLAVSLLKETAQIQGASKN